MNIIKTALAVIFSAALLTSCDSEKILPVDELPREVRSYVGNAYPESIIIYAKQETEWFTTTYEVQLDNGMKIEFNSQGTPIDIDNEAW